MGSEYKEIKILVTGGHHTTALALMQSLGKEFKSRGYGLSVFWVGHRYSMRGDRNESLEYKEITSLGIPFFELNTPKFYRHSIISTFAKLSVGVIRALSIVIKVRPQLVVSFGGYLAVPTVLAAWALSTPSVTHEQTASAGFANRFISRFCRKVYVSFASSLRYFPKRKTVLTGNPLREEIFIDQGLFKFNNKKRTIYVTGGKQGAHRMNLLVRESLPQLLEKYNVIHQCGSVSLHEDYEELCKYRHSLPQPLKESYEIRQHVNFSEIGSAFARADFVVSRAGANIVCELAQLKKRAVLIPLPGSSHGEQERNAKLLEDTGLGLVLPESKANTDTLMLSLENVSIRPISTEFISQEFPPEAGVALAKDIASLLL